MDPILSSVLGSMHGDIARLERVAMNISNAQTPGYKREVVAASSFGDRIDAGSALVAHTDQRPGTLKSTGQALDFALTGPGWFEVSTPQGAAYTRQGQFRLDTTGRLVTQQGHPVMGISGEIVLPDAMPSVDADGRISDAANGTKPGAPALAQLRVVQFEESATVQRLGNGLVLPQGKPSSAPEGATQIRQGYLENSNVNQMQEMVRLLETVRHLETLQKLALGYDEMLASSIRKLGANA